MPEEGLEPRWCAGVRPPPERATPLPARDTWRAMSQENVEVVLEFLRCGEANDVNGVATLVHPDVEATAVRDCPEPGPFLGADAVVAEFKRLTEWGEMRFTDFDLVADEGDWVVAGFRWQMRGAESGIETHFDVAVAVRVKEARVIEWHNRWTQAEALQAAGLSE
jgi:ketosteroid isomerase-like protein